MTLIRSLARKLRLLVAPGLWLLTFIPFGFFLQTVNGAMALTGAIFCTGMLFLFYAFYSLLSRNAFLREKTLGVANWVSRLVFQSSELRFRAGVFFIPVALAVLLGMRCNFLPIFEDSADQFAHSRLLLSGLFSVAAHPLPEFFDFFGIIQDTKWYSQYPLGHLLMLALGHALGAVWLINPLLCGGSVLLTYLLARDHYPLRTARMAGAMAAGCYQLLDMASEYMNHNTALFALMLFAFAWMRMLRAWEWRYASLSGYGLGLAAITRPMSALAMALPFLLYGFFVLLRSKPSCWLKAASGGLVFCAFILWQFYFNIQTTGQWWLFGYDVKYGEMVRLGFGQTITSPDFVGYEGYTHTLLKALGNLSNNLVGLNLFLFQWPAPCLIAVFLSVWAFKPDRLMKLMFSSWFALGFAYLFYFYQDWAFGPRFMHEAAGFLVILSAIGIARLPATLRALGLRLKKRNAMPELRVLLVALYACAGLLTLPTFSTYRHSNAAEIDAQAPANSLVFANQSFKYLMIFSPPLDSSRVIYARDLGEHNKALMDYYPQRSVYLETEKMGAFKKIR